LPTLNETITALAEDVAAKRKSLDKALASLDDWIASNPISAAERVVFSATLDAEKEAPTRDGKTYGDDRSLAGSIMRLHALRLLYRADEQREGPPPLRDESAYGRANYELQRAIRDTQIAVNEARIDTAIANAQQILGDQKANRRWLQDALIRVQTVAAKNLPQIAEAIPAPEAQPLGVIQKLTFRVLGIKQEEVAKRNLSSLRQMAQLQQSQLIEMVSLLSDSFRAAGDQASMRQALALLSQLQTAGTTPDERKRVQP
jgi:hypothetical protein